MSRHPTLTNRIKQLRLERGLTFQQVGDRIGSSGSTIQKLERGQMQLHLKWVERIAEAFDVDPLSVITDKYPRAQQQSLVPMSPDITEGDCAAGSGPQSFVAKADVLSDLGILSGDTLLVDTSGQNALESGSIVIAEWSGKDGSRVMLLRQFIDPHQLITNSSKIHCPIIHLKNNPATIFGEVTGITRSTTRRR